MANEREWTFHDKSKWPDRGPWDLEPDKVQWTDKATGLPCLAVRNRVHWCGYVGVSRSHPCYGLDYDAVYERMPDLDVHGGLTFADRCSPGDPETELIICHVPEPGQSDDVWWLGFDCAHGGDYRPADNEVVARINAQYPSPEGYETYRDLNYVRVEVAKLAGQLWMEQESMKS